jgi:hypothetical protein
VQASYDQYINYPQTVNAKEAVAGFLLATAIVEKPGGPATRKGNEGGEGERGTTS